MQLSDNGLRFIAGFEGFVNRPYNDPAGHCTVGFGHLIHFGECDGRSSEAPYRPTISQTEGLHFLRRDVVRFEECINHRVLRTLNQNRFDALVSFAFNVGCTAFENSTLLRKLNNGEYHRVCDELMRWIHGGGMILPGLVRRREAECELFNHPFTPSVISPIEEEEDEVRLVFKKGDDRVLATNGATSWHVRYPRIRDQMLYVGTPMTELPAAWFDALWETREEVK